MLFADLQNGLLADASSGNAEIESAPEFIELQTALVGKPGRQMGDAVIADIPPNYPHALGLTSTLLGQSKHMSLLAALAKAATGAHGFQGLNDALKLVQEVCDQQWNTLYPLEDKDDPEDPWWERLNLFRELTDEPLIRALLYRTEVVDVKHIGAFSVRDLDISSGRLDASDEEKERCNPSFVSAAFEEADRDQIKTTDDALQQIISSCTALESMITKHSKSDVISFDPLRQKIQEYQSTLRTYTSDLLESAVEESPELQEEITDGAAPLQATGQVLSVEPRLAVRKVAFDNRESVVQALQNIIQFYQKHEPSSPVPILVHRAKDMVHRNFFDILRELAPNHKDNFQKLTSTLKEDPLGFLMEHSFNSFLKGETLEIVDQQPVNHAIQPNQSSHQPEGMPGNISVPVPSESPSDTGEEITSRDQVLQTLKDIQKYFEVREPSSPVPLIVQRVCNLVPKGFLDLLSEFESVSEANLEKKVPNEPKEVVKKAVNKEAG